MYYKAINIKIVAFVHEQKDRSMKPNEESTDFFYMFCFSFWMFSGYFYWLLISHYLYNQFCCYYLVTKSYLTLFVTPMDCSLAGFSIHGIFQARILDWVAIPFSGGSSWLRYRISSSYAHISSLPLYFHYLHS